MSRPNAHASPSVLVTGIIPDAGLAVLSAAGLTVRMHHSTAPLAPAALRASAGRHDAVLCQLTDRIDESILTAAAPRCRIFANCAAGCDNIDLAAAARLGVVVTNTPDVLTEATADLTWALILAVARRITEAERVLRAGAWRGWRMLDFLGMELHGAALGVVGAGRIGAAVARRAGGFGMTVRYCSRRGRDAMDALGARRVPLPELLAASDVVSLHVPLTAETRHLIDAAALQRMKQTAVLINTARGSVVDEAALVAALRTGRIAGAGLDVFEREPVVSPALLELPNVVALPHIGSATLATRSRMARIAAANVVEVLAGRDPLNPVSF